MTNIIPVRFEQAPAVRCISRESNAQVLPFRRSRATDRVIAALKRLERAMEASAEVTDQIIDRAALLEQLSAAMARDYARTTKGKRDE
jgi:hypothetical protein